MMVRSLALAVLLCGAVAARGFDCQAAAKASATTCQAFGKQSHPCQLVRLHHIAKCANDQGDLGESNEAFESDQPGKKGLMNALKEEEQAATKGDIAETIRLANEVFDKATKMCKVAKHPLFVNDTSTSNATDASNAKGTKDVSTLTAEGVPANLANKLPLDAANELAKEIKKKEGGSLADPLGAGKKEISKEQALEMKEKLEAAKRDDAIKIQEAGAAAAAEGKDAEAVMKKLKAEAAKRHAEMEAAIPGSSDDSPAAQKVANDDLKKKQAAAEKENVKNMLGGLPPGKGLKTAFIKIEQSKLTAVKNAEAEKVAKAAAEMEEKKSDENMKSLTKEGQALLLKTQKKAQEDKSDMENPQKMYKEGNALKAEEEKIESQTPPGQSNDEQMFGKKEASSISDPSKIDNAKVAQAKADAAKTLKDMKNGMMGGGFGGTEEEVFMLD